MTAPSSPGVILPPSAHLRRAKQDLVKTNKRSHRSSLELSFSCPWLWQNSSDKQVKGSTVWVHNFKLSTHGRLAFIHVVRYKCYRGQQLTLRSKTGQSIPVKDTSVPGDFWGKTSPLPKSLSIDKPSTGSVIDEVSVFMTQSLLWTMAHVTAFSRLPVPILCQGILSAVFSLPSFKAGFSSFCDTSHDTLLWAPLMSLHPSQASSILLLYWYFIYRTLLVHIYISHLYFYDFMFHLYSHASSLTVFVLFPI